MLMKMHRFPKFGNELPFRKKKSRAARFAEVQDGRQLQVVFLHQLHAVPPTGLTSDRGLDKDVYNLLIRLIFYAEYIMRLDIDNYDGVESVGDRTINNLLYADDNTCTLLSGSVSELENLIERVRVESEVFGLFF